MKFKPNGETPSGMSMMLKALGINFDPEMVKKTVSAIEEVRARLQRNEEKLDLVLKHLGVEYGGGSSIITRDNETDSRISSSGSRTESRDSSIAD